MSKPNDENEIILDSEGKPEVVEVEDEEGNKIRLEIVGACIDRGAQYYALIPEGSADEEGGFEEFMIYKLKVLENGERELEEIEDDAEFERIADKFLEAFDTETDYD